MKKSVKLIDLDCANCAAKIEDAVKKIDGVTSASVSFMAQKMTWKHRTINSRRCLTKPLSLSTKSSPTLLLNLKELYYEISAD